MVKERIYPLPDPDLVVPPSTGIISNYRKGESVWKASSERERWEIIERIEKTNVELIMNSPYVVYEGLMTKIMPALKQYGRVPLSFSDYAEERLRNLGTRDEVFWWNYRCLDFSDSALICGDRIKIGLDYRILREIDGKTLFHDRELPIDIEVFNSFDSEEFSLEDLERFGVNLTWEERTKNHPILKSLARSQNLLNEYVDVVSRLGEKKTALVTIVDENGKLSDAKMDDMCVVIPKSSEISVVRVWNASNSVFGSKFDLYAREVLGKIPPYSALSRPGSALARWENRIIGKKV